MQTEPEENKYVRELRQKNLELTAENLLHILRPYVEDLLAEYGRLQPPSQSYRASRLLAEIRSKKLGEATRSGPEGHGVNIRKHAMLCRQEDLLRYFMAVHRTVWILEGRPV